MQVETKQTPRRGPTMVRSEVKWARLPILSLRRLTLSVLSVGLVGCALYIHTQPSLTILSRPPHLNTQPETGPGRGGGGAFRILTHRITQQRGSGTDPSAYLTTGTHAQRKGREGGRGGGGGAAFRGAQIETRRTAGQVACRWGGKPGPR